MTRLSEADTLTETRFYFDEPDGCARCGQHFTEYDVAEGLEWYRDDPMHKACFQAYESDLYDGWKGVATI